jgi:hypothetical protein
MEDSQTNKNTPNKVIQNNSVYGWTINNTQKIHMKIGMNTWAFCYEQLSFLKSPTTFSISDPAPSPWPTDMYMFTDTSFLFCFALFGVADLNFHCGWPADNNF